MIFQMRLPPHLLRKDQFVCPLSLSCQITVALRSINCCSSWGLYFISTYLQFLPFSFLLLPSLLPLVLFLLSLSLFLDTVVCCKDISWYICSVLVHRTVVWCVCEEFFCAVSLCTFFRHFKKTLTKTLPFGWNEFAVRPICIALKTHTHTQHQQADTSPQ